MKLARVRRIAHPYSESAALATAASADAARRATGRDGDDRAAASPRVLRNSRVWPRISTLGPAPRGRGRAPCGRLHRDVPEDMSLRTCPMDHGPHASCRSSTASTGTVRTPGRRACDSAAARGDLPQRTRPTPVLPCRMPSRRLLLSCLLLAACPPRTPPQPPPGDTSTPGEEGTPDASRVPELEVAPPAPDDPDAPDEPGDVEPGERPSPAKPKPKPSSTRADNDLADTLSPRASRSASRRPATGGCEQGKRRVGETWKVECNACSCGDDGQSTCTAMACEPAPAR